MVNVVVAVLTVTPYAIQIVARVQIILELVDSGVGVEVGGISLLDALDVIIFNGVGVVD